jgi:hypothetical protein
MDNHFYCYSDKDGIGFGSDPLFGLYIDNTVSKGSSHNCKTYSNGLLSDTEYFKIKELEVFGWVGEGEIY